MSYVPATTEYGLVVRREAIKQKGITPDRLFDALRGVDLIGEDPDIISFGPIFGEEAQLEIAKKLKSLGLEYVDDFVALDFMAPSWLAFGVTLAS